MSLMKADTRSINQLITFSDVEGQTMAKLASGSISSELLESVHLDDPLIGTAHFSCKLVSLLEEGFIYSTRRGLF